MKTDKAKLILIQLEAIRECENSINTAILVNEVLRDAKQLAEEVLETEDKVA